MLLITTAFKFKIMSAQAITVDSAKFGTIIRFLKAAASSILCQCMFRF